MEAPDSSAQRCCTESGVEVMTADVNKGITYRLDAGIDLIEVRAARAGGETGASMQGDRSWEPPGVTLHRSQGAVFCEET